MSNDAGVSNADTARLVDVALSDNIIAIIRLQQQEVH